MCTLKIGIICLAFASWPDRIESSSPDENLLGFSRREKLPIRRSTRNLSRQSPVNSCNSSQPSQLAEWELSSPSGRNLHGSKFHSLPSQPHGIEQNPATDPAAATSSAPAESSLRSRSRSPPGKPPSYSTLFGVKIDNLRFQRFLPVKNSSRELVIRMYDFRPGTQIYMKDQPGRISEPLTGVQFIISGLNGDALAIVTKQKSGHTILRGLYMPPGPKGIRAKINIFTHHVSSIEPEEANDTPLGCTSFHNYLTKKTVDDPVEPFFPVGSTSNSIPSYNKLFGIKMEELPFYRFFPVRNPTWELGIQSYTFPLNVEVHLRIENNNLDPNKLTGEKYLLTDMNGYAVAIVKKQTTGQSLFRGLYLPRPSHTNGNRVKVNIFTNSVKQMEEDEVYSTPITRSKDIRNYYDIRHVGVRFAPRRSAG